MECPALSVLLAAPRVRLWSKLDHNFDADSLVYMCEGLCRARVMECPALSVLLAAPRVRLWSKLDHNFDADSLVYMCEGDS